MKKLYYLLFAFSLFAFTSCSQDSEISEYGTATRQTSYNNDVIHVESANVGNGHGTFIGYIKSEGISIKSKGFIYSVSNEEPKIGVTGCYKRTINSSSDTISYTVTIAKIDVNYYFRGFVITESNDTIYSDVGSIKESVSVPEIETLPITNRVKIAAIVLGHFKNYGNVAISSFGICINKTGFPTLKDKYMAAVDTAKDSGYKGQFGVFFDTLSTNTMYHVRAYCIYTYNNNVDTLYANDRIFKTSLGGDVQWSWGTKSSDDAANARIAQAMDSAMYYYNNYSNLKHRITVNYSSGVPTAQCNILGDMSYGAVERYQWVGTAQHELCHAMGAGTAWNWSSFGSPWSGTIATQALKVMMMDMSEVITKDTQHFWPGGINQREEVTNGTANSHGVTIKNERMLKTNVMVINGMREDGLYG